MTQKNHFDGQSYADHFAAHASSLPSADVKWLREARLTSIEAFNKVGLPGPKVEEWRYSNLNFLKDGRYGVLSDGDTSVASVKAEIERGLLSEVRGDKVVFIDGTYSAEHSNIKGKKGIILCSLNEFIKREPEQAKVMLERKAESSSLNDLNSALMTDGYVLLIKQDIKLSETIQIVHVTTQRSSDKLLNNKNFIKLESSAEAEIVEVFFGNKNVSCWDHLNTDIILQENAKLTIYQMQDESAESIHMAETTVSVNSKAQFKHFSLNVGAKLSRTEIKPTLVGLDGSVELHGAFLARDGSSHDVFTHMKHMVPEGISNQVYRGVLDKGGKSAFQGKVYVAKDAQLTNADQSNKNLLLDRNAEANSKPELLIYADDVKCTHGATVGELDHEAMFYLKSRGLDQQAAKALLVEAFIAEVYQDVKIDAVRQRYLDRAQAWLKQDG